MTTNVDVAPMDKLGIEARNAPDTATAEAEAAAAAEAEDRGDNAEPEAVAVEAEPVVEAEAEAEAEVEVEVEAEAEAEVDTAGNMIPMKRFTEVNERMKRAERLLAEKDAAAKPPAEAEVEEFDFDGKEAEYMEAVLDGEAPKAQAIRREIRAAEEAKYTARMDKVQESSVSQSKAQREFDAVVTSLEANVPRFDPAHADFDADIVSEVLELQGGLVAAGYTPADALSRAARYVVGDAADGKPAPAPVADNTAAEAAAAAAAKKAAGVAAKVKTAGKVAPALSGGDGGSTVGDGVVNMDTISEAEFDALPESKKRELRGDVVA